VLEQSIVLRQLANSHLVYQLQQLTVPSELAVALRVVYGAVNCWNVSPMPDCALALQLVKMRLLLENNPPDVILQE
jgi:hypothetical protein